MKQETKMKRIWIPFTLLAAITIGALSYFLWSDFSLNKPAGYTGQPYESRQEETVHFFKTLQGEAG